MPLDVSATHGSNIGLGVGEKAGQWKHEEEAVVNCQREQGDSEKRHICCLPLPGRLPGANDGLAGHRNVARSSEFFMIDGEIL